VHRSTRGRTWVASFFTSDGQEWRSTGTTDRALALARAKKFEAAARRQKPNAAPVEGRPPLVLRQTTRHRDRGLTQREVGLLLGLTERAVRRIEKIALRKLARHPDLWALWRQYQAGELTEQGHRLATPEILALVGLTRRRAEREALHKAMAQVQSRADGYQPAS
jgi:hypothetical protein